MMEAETKLSWFGIKVFHPSKIKIYATEFADADIEHFVPYKYIVRNIDGRVRVEHKPLESLMFIRTSMDKAMNIRVEYRGRLMFYENICDDKRCLQIIPDREMAIFRLVTSTGDTGLKYYSEDAYRYAVGKKVRVIDGPLKGAEGYIKRIKHEHRLLVSIRGICAVATSYIPSAFLRDVE